MISNTPHNAENERIKKAYFAYLKDALGKSESTIDEVAKALARFETDTNFRDFKKFKKEEAIAFKAHLAEQESKVTGEKLSKSTMHATLGFMKQFFFWVFEQKKIKTKYERTDAEYFNQLNKDIRIATTRRTKSYPTLEQMKHVIQTMPNGTEIEKRNRAIVAFTVLTGARVGAIASMKLKHIDLEAGRTYQDAREVNTKFSKSFNTYFFPVDKEFHQIFIEWVDYLRKTKLWCKDDPLFPSTEVKVGASRHYEVFGIKKENWSGASPIRQIFKDAFTNAGLKYFNPHSIRNTLVDLAETICLTPKDFKAWSQNLGHEKVMTTFSVYGAVNDKDQGEIIRGLSNPRMQSRPDFNLLAKAIAREVAAQKGFGATLGAT